MQNGALAEQFLEGCNGRFLQSSAYDGYSRLSARSFDRKGLWTLGVAGAIFGKTS
jgi:hypothetical protein